MKSCFTVLIIILCVNLYCQDSLNINVYNRWRLTKSFNGADPNNTPIKNINSNVNSWLYLENTVPAYLDFIEVTFWEKHFETTQFIISINNRIDTITIDNLHWLIEIQDTLHTFSINKTDCSYGPLIDSIKFLRNNTELNSVFVHKKSINNPGVNKYYDEIERGLIESKASEYTLTEKFYNKHLLKLLNQEKRSEIKKLLSEYHEDPQYELYKLVVSAADESNSLASNYISGNKYSTWTRKKKIRKGKSEYLRSAKLYEKAQLLDHSKDNSLTYKAVAAYNQAEKFNKAKKLLQPFIKNSKFDYKFFDYYFMTRNKVSRIKQLRENGFLYYSCGGSPDAIDSEHFFSSIILSNSSILYKEEKYDLLIEYLKKAKIRINWSEDVRLNRINEILCQMLIEALEHKYSITEIKSEFEQAKISTEEFEYYGIGDSMNYPKGTLKLFEIPLKLYDSKSSNAKYLKEKNEKPLINFERQNENMKEKTILSELLSITIGEPAIGSPQSEFTP